MMKRISLKGVTIGAVTDIVATNIVSLPLMIYIMASLNSSGLPPDKIASAITDALYGSSLYFSLSWFLGGLCSVLGGYVAARIAKHDEILNGALSSVLCLGFSAYTIISGSAGDRVWLHLVLLPLTPALATAGGYLRWRKRQA